MEDFRIVIAGCGNMANKWVKYALTRSDSKIVGLMDIEPNNAKALADRYDLNVEIFTDLKKAISKTMANMVFDVTIPDAHFDTVTTALTSNCTVFGEKPMASSIESAKTMVKIANDTGSMYSVMQNRRYNKNIRQYRQLIKDGMIGNPEFICADFFIGAHFGGFRDIMDSPLLLDMAIHTFDQARFLISSDPLSVYCYEFNPKSSWYKGNSSAICIFEFSNGEIFNYRGSWSAEGANTSWEASWRIVGSKGTAVWDGHTTPYCEVLADVNDEKYIRDCVRIDPKELTLKNNGHFACLDEMFQALKDNKRSETDCNDNIKSVAMVYGAEKSAKQGRKIILEY